MLTGLGLGGDDYLTKPFRVAELRARVAAHLRREQRTPRARLRRGGLDFDLGERAVFYQDAPIKLTRSEYAICEHLAMRPGQTFSKEQLYEAAFGYDGTADASAVTEHIKNIRAKLRPAGINPIETVWGGATSGKAAEAAERPHIPVLAVSAHHRRGCPGTGRPLVGRDDRSDADGRRLPGQHRRGGGGGGDGVPLRRGAGHGGHPLLLPLGPLRRRGPGGGPWEYG